MPKLSMIKRLTWEEYVLIFYLLMFDVLGAFMIGVPLRIQDEFEANQILIIEKHRPALEQEYRVSMDSLPKYKCYMNKLHYHSMNMFGGLLPEIPSVPCSEDKLKQDINLLTQQVNPVIWIMLVLGMVIVALTQPAFAYIYRRVRNRENQDV